MSRTQSAQPVPADRGNHPDRLGDIFDTQAYFLRTVADQPAIDFTQDPLLPDDAQVLTEWVNEYGKAIFMEACELMDWTPWKHWSTRLGNKREDVRPWSPEHVREMRMECADLLCFLVNACAVLGMNSQDLYDTYRAKADINIARQASGSY